MIKASELRLGNWVSCEGKPYQVNMNILQSFTVSPVWMDPIPLTPEILEKCDFDEWGFQIVRKDGYISIQANQYIMDEENEIATCEYLHQLQNLYFALTGEELEIKTPAANTF